MNTVNVIEYFADTIQSLYAFADDMKGNEEAEKLFYKLALEQGFTEDDIEDVGFEEGCLEKNDYKVFIVHNHPYVVEV